MIRSLCAAVAVAASVVALAGEQQPIFRSGVRTVPVYATAVDTLAAQGDVSRPGPGAAWFRLAVPMVRGAPNSPAMRAAAAADFGNGLSWVLPPDSFLFSNADLNLHLHRQPVGEWIGLSSETQADASGAGTTLSRLYDEQGPIGVAVQTLVLRDRSA